MEKTRTSISIRTDILTKADKLLSEGKFPGIRDRSALIEKLLSELVTSET